MLLCRVAELILITTFKCLENEFILDGSYKHYSDIICILEYSALHSCVVFICLIFEKFILKYTHEKN